MSLGSEKGHSEHKTSGEFAWYSVDQNLSILSGLKLTVPACNAFSSQIQ